MTEASNVIPFPRTFHMLPALVAGDEDITPVRPRQAVDHDGRVYPLQDLLRGLSVDQLRAVEEAAPRSGQESWDRVVHNWPALADQIAAGLPRIR